MIITKERDDQSNHGLMNRRTDFPKLILEEENLAKNEGAEQSNEKTLSSREIITFLLFCAFFLVTVYLQVDVETNYKQNQAIKLGLQNNAYDFENINIERDYWIWFSNFVDNLYTPEYYANYSIPGYRQHAMPNLNVLISQIRITQRRMKLVPNDDIYTQAYIKEGWASLGFKINDRFDSDVETKDSFGYTSIDTTHPLYHYQLDDTYDEKGGFLQALNVINIEQAQAQSTINNLQANGFIDKQTRSIVIDLVLFNSYTKFFTVVNLIAVFEANGLITTTLQLYNIKRNYYEGFIGYFRMVCEICFCVLLAFYLIIETIEIIGDISGKKKEFVKEQKKKIAREKRRKDIYDDQEQDQAAIEVNVTGSPEIQKVGKKIQTSNFTLPDLNKDQDNKKNEGDKQIVFHWCHFFVSGIKEHYTDGWNWVDTSFLLLSLIAVSIWASIVSQHVKTIASYEIGEFQNIQNNENFFDIAYKMLIYQRICSINFILLFVKILKYLASWFDRVMVIFKTLAYAKSDIFYFLIMYIIIFFAFVVMCHIYYGADLTDFGTILNSLKTLFLMLLGDLDFLDDMIELNKVLSFFFFIAFMTSMQFILVNMFIAFISNAYGAVNESISSSKKLEEELKQKHFLVKIGDAWNWFKSRVTRSKKSQEIDKQKAQRAQELIQKNISKKFQQMLSLRRQENNKEEEAKEPIKKKLVLNTLGGDNPTNKSSNGGLEKFAGLPGMLGQIAKKTHQNTNKSLGNANSQNIQGKTPHDVNDDNIINSTDGGGTYKDNYEGEEEDDDLMQKSRLRQEEERSKIILTRKEWDKNFDQNQFYIDEPLLPSLLSEKQEVQGQKERELRCGRIMWTSIAFTIYAALYISLILIQLNVERNYWYNTAVVNVLQSLQFDVPLKTIYEVETYADLYLWFSVGFSAMAIEITQPYSNFTGYYVNDVNYILGGKFRLCFNYNANKNYGADDAGLPDYFKENKVILSKQYTQTFTGVSSGTQYNFTDDGFQNKGSYCQDVSFDADGFNSSISNIFDDQIITDQLEQLTVEYVTFEASQSVHTYTSIQFQFPQQGLVVPKININTLELDMYKEKKDYVRLGFEIFYIILLIYNIGLFVKQLVSKHRQYQRWKKVEIDSLSEIERKQRHQKRPEWLRQWDALFTAFVYFDIIYFTLALTSIVLWILYIQGSSLCNFPLPPSDDNSNFIPLFYDAQKLLMNYTNVVAINTIFLSVKLFDYMNKSKHMKMLSSTLNRAKEDTFYFLIIFSIFLFGFVGMAYVSFGPHVEDFSTLGNAVRKCFEITIGDFDYQSLEDANAPMAIIFFFPFNIMFVFILLNIFLAIINEAYEKNQMVHEENEDISFLSSIFYCMIPNESNSSKANKKKLANKAKKSQQNDHLEVFEKLVVNLQISMSDLKAWAINCADEIKSELKKRTQLRHENRELLMNKFKKMKSVEEGRSGGIGVAAHGKRFDEVECYKKRLQYWDYIRNGLQFISFQNKILDAVLKQKEREIQHKTEQYYKEKEKTQEIYKYLALLEKPVEDKLDQIMNYRKVLKLLDQEKQMLINQQEKEEEEDKDGGEYDDVPIGGEEYKQSRYNESDQDVRSHNSSRIGGIYKRQRQ